MKSSSIFEAQEVRTPRVQKISLWAIGMPSKGESSPLRMRISARLASAKADLCGRGDESVDFGIVRLDAGKKMTHEFDAGEFLFPQGIAEFSNGERVHVHLDIERRSQDRRPPKRAG